MFLALACFEFCSGQLSLLRIISLQSWFISFLANLVHLVINSFLSPTFPPFPFMFPFRSCFPFQILSPHWWLLWSFPRSVPPHSSMSHGDETMEIYDEEEYVDTSHPVMYQTCQQAARIQRLDRADYSHEELYIKLSRIPVPWYTLRVICQTPCKYPVNSMSRQRFHYIRWMMAVVFQAVGNPLDATVTLIFWGDGRPRCRQEWAFPDYYGQASSSKGLLGCSNRKVAFHGLESVFVGALSCVSTDCISNMLKQ